MWIITRRRGHVVCPLDSTIEINVCMDAEADRYKTSTFSTNICPAKYGIPIKNNHESLTMKKDHHE